MYTCEKSTIINPFFDTILKTGTHAKNMAQGATDVGKGAVLGAASIARGAATGVANVATGAADAIKNTFGGAAAPADDASNHPSNRSTHPHNP